MGKNHRTGALEPLDFNHLVRNMPEFEHVGAQVDAVQFQKPIDSSDVTPGTWADIVGTISSNYREYDGFVVLHGTDTMAYTAAALSFMLENTAKPVILTGSQLPIGQLRTDGKGNLLTSIELAAKRNPDGAATVPEVCIFFGGKLLRGNRATKRSADGFDAFASFNFPHLCEAGVDFAFNHGAILRPDPAKPFTAHTRMDTNTAVLSLFPGVRADIVGHVLDTPNLKSIVLRTYGSGNAPHGGGISDILCKAAERGVVVVNISQCISGSVEMARYDTGLQLQGMGVVSGMDSTVEAAVAKLMFLQGLGLSPGEIREAMGKPICGEITAT